jgi:hypothetical protein
MRAPLRPFIHPRLYQQSELIHLCEDFIITGYKTVFDGVTRESNILPFISYIQPDYGLTIRRNT